MITITNAVSMNWDNALRGMRHPLESYSKSDSKFYPSGEILELGKKDLILAKKLIKAGSDHRKFLRQILCNIEITAPLYFYKQFDTYKISTTANSTSTMHTLNKKTVDWGSFSFNSSKNVLNSKELNVIQEYISLMERLRIKSKGSDENWKSLIEMLPSSFLQTRTVTLNYEVLLNMYFSRKNHKLSEWRELCELILKEFPYFKELISND